MASDTPVSAVMTREVLTLRAEQPIDEAADVLASHGFGAAPVVDAGGKVIGLLRDEDLLVSEARLHVPTVVSLLGAELVWPPSLHRYQHELEQAAGATVGDVMTTDFATVGPDASLEDLATLMHGHDVTHVPVVGGDGKLVGIAARGDLVRFLAERS